MTVWERRDLPVLRALTTSDDDNLRHGFLHLRSKPSPLGLDLSPSEWIRPRLRRWGVVEGTPVTSQVPSGYPRYVRVLHPAQRPPGDEVPWREITAWSGRVYHPLMQFERIREPVSRAPGPPPFDRPPPVGTLSPALCAGT